MPAEHPDLDRYLEEVSAHLPRRAPRAEILAELRAAALDRAEDEGAGAPTADGVRRAISALGDPASVALAYAGERYLIGPRVYASFMAYTGIVFAIHLVMIVAATAFDAAIEVFPIAARGVAGAGLLRFLVAALQALVFDVGLMVVIFGLAERTRRAGRLPSLAFPVRSGLRHCAGRATLALVVLLALNIFRDSVFVVWTGDRPHSLLTRSFTGALPVINVLLGLLVLREVLYATLGERRWLLAADAMVSATGAVTMIWLITRSSLIAFPAEVVAAPDAVPTLNHLVSGATRIILLLFAAGFAVEAVKRFYRMRHLPA